MQDIRVAIEGLTNEIMGLRHENNSLKLEIIKLTESSKARRSDIIMNATVFKKTKFVPPIGDDKLSDYVARGLPQLISSSGAHSRYSDIAADKWIAENLTKN